MYHRSGRAALVAIILFVASGGLAQTKTVDEIIAWVNSDIILKSEFETRKAQIRNDLSEPAPRGATGIGLKVMRYRARLIGGDLIIGSPPAGGTRVACHLPFPS